VKKVIQTELKLSATMTAIFFISGSSCRGCHGCAVSFHLRKKKIGDMLLTVMEDCCMFPPFFLEQMECEVPTVRVCSTLTHNTYVVYFGGLLRYDRMFIQAYLQAHKRTCKVWIDTRAPKVSSRPSKRPIIRDSEAFHAQTIQVSRRSLSC